MFIPPTLQQNKRRKNDVYVITHHAACLLLVYISEIVCHAKSWCTWRQEFSPRGVMLCPESQLAGLDLGLESGSPLSKCDWGG